MELKSLYTSPVMKKILFFILALCTGALLSISIFYNAELGLATTNEVSMITNQLVGVIFLSAIMFAGKKSSFINPTAKKPAKWYMYFAGLFGLIIMTANYYGLTNLGVTLSTAGVILGQGLTGLITDLTGFLGMKKRKIEKGKVISLCVSSIGIIIMTAFSQQNILTNILYILLCIFCGSLSMIQMIYNASLANSRGIFFSARQNVLSGVLACTLFAFIVFPKGTISGFQVLPSIPLHIILLGGLTGGVYVLATNIVVPQIPAVISALLLASGQIIMSVILDKVFKGIFSLPLLIGTIFIMLGVFINYFADKNKNSNSNKE